MSPEVNVVAAADTKKLSKKAYEKELERLQVELVKF